jgi:hypothetical protein
MKLSQSQIDTIIEGLENPNTRLESTNVNSNTVTNVIRKLKNGKYRNSVVERYRNFWNPCNIKFKSDIIGVLERSEYFMFELVTINDDKSETRIKI